jgi:hypothetical protein
MRPNTQGLRRFDDKKSMAAVLFQPDPTCRAVTSPVGAGVVLLRGLSAQAGDCVFDSALSRNLDAKSFFSQERATYRDLQISACQFKAL